MHHFNQRGDPIFKFTVVFVGYQQTSDPVDSFLAKLSAILFEISHECWLKAFDEILFDATGGDDDAVNHAVLHKKSQYFALSARNLIGGVSEKDAGTNAFSQLHGLELWVVGGLPWYLTEASFAHLLNLLDRQAQVGGLKSSVPEGLHDFGHHVSFRGREIDTLTNGHVDGHGRAFAKDGGGRH
jgi:hypothetical protein